MQLITKIYIKLGRLYRLIKNCLLADVYFGKHMTSVPNHSIVFFPCHERILCCGITGIVSFKNKKEADDHADLPFLNGMLEKLEAIESKYEELTRLLISPDVLSNPPVLQRYSKEQAELTPLVDKIRGYRKLLAEIEEIERAIDDKEKTLD